MERGTGARGLRSLMEQVLRKPMFSTPSLSGVRRCVVDEAAVTGDGEVTLIPGDDSPEAPREAAGGE